MYLTVHSTAALVIAQYAPNPIIGFLLGVISHIILDFIPHGDEASRLLSPQESLIRLLRFGFIDGLILLLVFWCYYQKGYFTPSIIVLSTVFGAVLPDILMGWHIITKVSWLNKISYIHKKIHNPLQYYLGLNKGLLLQILTLIALVIVLNNQL